MNRDIKANDFREWVKKASNSELEDFIEEIEDIILDLEEDDFFGNDGYFGNT